MIDGVEEAMGELIRERWAAAKGKLWSGAAAAADPGWRL